MTPAASEQHAYADLDVRIGEQEALRQQSSKGYQTYLKNEQTAKLLPEREQAYQKALRVAHAAEQARNAGCDEVMPRSSFTQNLAEILSPAKA